MQKLDPGRAFPVELPAVAPPQHVVFRIEKGLPVAGVPAPEAGLPEPAGKLLAGDVPPAHVQVPLVGDFVPHHGLAVADAVLCGVLHVAVQVLPLHGAVGHPGPGVIVKGHAVVHRPQVVVGVLLAQKARRTAPSPPGSLPSSDRTRLQGSTTSSGRRQTGRCSTSSTGRPAPWSSGRSPTGRRGA